MKFTLIRSVGLCWALILTIAGTVQAEIEPFVFTPERIDRAKLNIEKYTWARTLMEEIIQDAQEAVAQPDEVIDEWFLEETPINQCSCPSCGAYWLNYIWEWSPEAPGQVVCNQCEAAVSPETYPANATVILTDPQGKRVPHPVYQDESGQRFPVRQVVGYYKAQKAYAWIDSLGMAYALTGNSAYAATAERLLLRLAEVYPGYVFHDNFRFDKRPWGWAGKLTGWHFQDAGIFMKLGATWDAIRRSPVIHEASRDKIERDLFRLGGEMLTSVRPLQGISNDVPFRFGAVALIARLLDDQDILDWVLQGPESYENVAAKLFFKDGAWHERAPSYHNMVSRGMPLAPYYLRGYKDRSGNPIRLHELAKLGTIQSSLFDMRFPDGNLPPVNDSRYGTRIDPAGMEMMFYLKDNDTWLAYLDAAWKDNEPEGMLEHGDRFALFHRPPDVDDRLAVLDQPVDIPMISQDFTGHALFMLRRGTRESPTVFTMHHHKWANSHGHYDALSTILWAEGREMLSDIGYALFGIRERSTWYMASLSHNTLTVDTFNQRAPNGVANFIHHGELFSACEGESWDSYRFICEPFTRQIALIDTPGGRPYALDIFRGGGGQTHDFALHGEGPVLEVSGVDLKPADRFEGKDYAYEEVRDVKKSDPLSEPWQAAWRWEDGVSLDVFMAGQEDTQVITSRSPGMRVREQRGREIHSLFSRRRGESLRSEFVGVYDPNRGNPVIRSVEKLSVTQTADWAIVLKVQLEDVTDYIFSSYIDIAPNGEVFEDGVVRIPWESRMGVVRVKDGVVIESEWIDAPMEGLQHDI